MTMSKNWIPREAGQVSNIMFKQSAPLEVIYCSRDGVSQFRPLPAFNPDGTAKPMRTGGELMDLSDWIMSMPAAFYWGAKSVSFWDVCSDQQEKYPMGVAHKCAQEIELAVQSGIAPQFKGLLEGRYRVSYPGQYCVVQCFLFAHQSKGLEQSWPCVFLIKPSAGEDLEEALQARISGQENAVVDGANYQSIFKSGKFLDPNEGLVWKIVPEEMQKKSRRGTRPSPVNQGKKGFVRFTLKFGDAYPVPDATAKQFVHPWERIINLPTRREAWSMVYKAIGGAATSYAGRDEIENLPGACQEMARQWLASTANVGGVPQAGVVPEIGGGVVESGEFVPPPPPPPPGAGEVPADAAPPAPNVASPAAVAPAAPVGGSAVPPPPPPPPATTGAAVPPPPPMMAPAAAAPPLPVAPQAQPATPAAQPPAANPAPPTAPPADVPAPDPSQPATSGGQSVDELNRQLEAGAAPPPPPATQ